MESTKEYLKLFNACPIKIGDTVRVLRGWKNGEYGCNLNCSIKFSCLGVDYVVTDKYKDYYEIENEDDTWYVPFFVLEVVKSASSNIATSDDYLAFHEASGLKVGDKVKITRKASDNEIGWSNVWVDKMDRYIGDIGEIIEDDKNDGWLVDVRGIKHDFPTFILQKIDEPAKKEEVKYVPEEILVKENSVVVNGCELTKELVGAIHYKLFRRGKKRGKKKGEVKHKAHNPDNLTPEQYGKSEGYRLLDEDEIKVRTHYHKEIEVYWVNKEWIKGNKGGGEFSTYRTKLSREELAKLE